MSSRRSLRLKDLHRIRIVHDSVIQCLSGESIDAKTQSTFATRRSFLDGDPSGRRGSHLDDILFDIGDGAKLDFLRTEFPAPDEYALQPTAWLWGMGRRDPTMRFEKDGVQACLVTPEGPVSISVFHEPVANQLLVESCGSGREWIQSRLPDLLGLNDDSSSFVPDGRLKRVTARFAGARLPVLPVVFHRLVQIILQQLVSWRDAMNAWRQICKQFGTDAPGPYDLRLPPTASELKQLAYFELVECGILPRQARLILQVAKESRRIEKLASQNDRKCNGPDALAAFLHSIPGIGPWTVQHLLGTSMGCADAVVLGDYGLPHSVAWVLTGKERSNDEEMLQLLEPYVGDRFRVINIVWQSGELPPRRGPRRMSTRKQFGLYPARRSGKNSAGGRQ